MHDAYKLAGFKGNSVSAPYKLEEKIKEHALTDYKLLKTSKKVAKHILEIAEDTLKNRRDDPAIQTLCVKSAIQIIEGQQDRIEPKKNSNFNAIVNANLDGYFLNYSQKKRGCYAILEFSTVSRTVSELRGLQVSPLGRNGKSIGFRSCITDRVLLFIFDVMGILLSFLQRLFAIQYLTLASVAPTAAINR